MPFGYRYTLEPQENGWWLVRFPGIPEAPTEGEAQEEARADAVDCAIAAGRLHEGRQVAAEARDRTFGARPRRAAFARHGQARDLRDDAHARLVETQIREATRLARKLGARPPRLRHSSHMRIIDEALAKMNAELPIDLPKPRARRRAA